METKIKWGSLDVAARTLEEVPMPLQSLYDSQEYRMKPEDVKRLESYLKRYNQQIVKIKSTLKLFKAINKV